MVTIKAGTKEDCIWGLPDEFYYHEKDHIWAKVEDDKVTFGLDAFGTWAAGEIKQMRTFPVGRTLRKNQAFGNIESGKYIGPMRAPVSGKIIEVNTDVVSNPSKVNQAPYENWVIVIEAGNLDEDLKGLPHGKEGIEKWMKAEIDDYASKDLLKCD